MPEDWELKRAPEQSLAPARPRPSKAVGYLSLALLAIPVLAFVVYLGSRVLEPQHNLNALAQADATTMGQVAGKDCSGRYASSTETIRFKVGRWEYSSTGYASCHDHVGDPVEVAYSTADPSINSANLSIDAVTSTAGSALVVPVLALVGFPFGVCCVLVFMKVKAVFAYRRRRLIPGFVYSHGGLTPRSDP